MVRWNPCCLPLVLGLRAIAYVQIARSVFYLILEGVALGSVIGSTADQTAEEVKELEGSKLAIVSFITFLMSLDLVQLGLAILLKVGAEERNHRKCKIWFIGNCVLLGIQLLLSIISAAVYPSGAYYIIGDLLLYAIDVYCMVVVFAFLDELTSDLNNSAGQVA